MTKHSEVVLFRATANNGPADPDQLEAEGQEMALIDPAGAFETIEIKRATEAASQAVLVQQLDFRSSAVLGRGTSIRDRLTELGFDPAEHLHQIIQGKIDLGISLILLGVGAGLTILALLPFAPIWLAIPVGFLVLGAAVSIEEFFEAHKQKDAFREAVFMVLSLAALAGQVWLGTLRGLLLMAVAPPDVGSATHALGVGALVLRWTLGIFSLVAEALAGYKLWRAREALLSPTAQAVRERDHCELELLALRDLAEAAKIEAEIRHHYRTIGAREQLASAASAAGRHESTHLQRAFKGAIIALLLFALLLFFTSRLSAETLRNRNTAVLLDLSKSEPIPNLQANIRTTSDLLAILQPGDRIVVVGISSDFGRPVILLDEAMPAKVSRFGLEERAGREAIVAKWNQISKDLKPMFPTTDVVGALATLPFLADFDLQGARIYILGDMQQSTPELDLEHANRIPVEQTIAKLKRAGAIPSLKGAEILALGVDPIGKSREYFLTLHEFWAAYFRESGAVLRIFTIDRHFPDSNRVLSDPQRKTR